MHDDRTVDPVSRVEPVSRLPGRIAVAVGGVTLAVFGLSVVAAEPHPGSSRLQGLVGAVALAGFLAFLAYTLANRWVRMWRGSRSRYSERGRKLLILAYAGAPLLAAVAFGTSVVLNPNHLGAKALMACILTGVYWLFIWLAAPIVLEREP